MLRIFCSILFVISPFFTGKVFSQKTAFFQHKVELDEAMGQNQLVSVTRDKNGYYWMLTASHKILKWDGRNFTRMDSLPAYKLSLKDYWFQLCYDNKGKPFFFHAGKIILYIDENSQLKVLHEEKGHDKMMHSLGTYYYFDKPWDLIKGMNAAAVFDEFYKAYLDYGNSIVYGIDDNEIYIKSKFGWHYCNNGAIRKIKGKQTFDVSAFVIGKSFVLLYSNGQYESYTGGSLVASGSISQPGFLPSFHNITASRVTSWWRQTQGTATNAMFASGECIYNLTLSNNRPVLSKYFVIPGNQKYIDFYCDLEKERVFLIDPRGGFIYFEKRPVFTFLYHQSIDSGVIHSISNRPDGVLRTNQYHQKILSLSFENISYLESVSPIVYHKGRYYYFASNTVFAISTAGRVEEKIPLPGDSKVFAAVETDSVVYFQGGKLFSLLTNNRTTRIKELAFYEEGIKIAIDYIVNGGDHLLYAFSRSNGYVYELNVKQLSSKRITSLPIQNCRSISFDKMKNLLLIATYGNGPVIVSLADGKQIDLPMDASSSLLSCHYILTDRDGDWWLPTNAGLFYMSAADLALYLAGKLQTLVYRKIENEFNMPIIEYNGSYSTSGFMTGDSAFFSTMEAVVGINTVYVKSLFKENRAVVFLDEIKINGAVAGLSDLKGIDPAFKSLEFKFSIPFIQYPGLLLQYRILGYKDTSWQYLPDEKLSLGFLTPGSYTLQVRTTNSNLYEMKDIPVVIETYWYNTFLARVLFVAAALLFIWIVVRAVVLRNRNAALEQINRSRQELFRIVAHDLKSPVGLYRGLTDLAAYLIQKQDFERLVKVSREIDETSQELDLLLKNLLHWSMGDHEKFIFESEEIQVNELLDQILPIYKRIAAVKGIRIELWIEDDTIIHSSYSGLSIVFRNLLDNAIKYAVPDSVLTVESFVDEFSYNFKVYNSVSEQQREWLEERKRQGARKSEADLSRASGLGMGIISKVLLELGGQLFVFVVHNKVICHVNIPVKASL